MPTYVISSHGESVYDNQTTIPANTSVQFYQPFGREMPMGRGFALQTAITHPHNIISGQVKNQCVPKSLWNGIPQVRSQKPGVRLTPDTNNEFKCGIVRADPNYAVIYTIGNEITLTEALAIIRADANKFGQDTPADVHCLVCL